MVSIEYPLFACIAFPLATSLAVSFLLFGTQWIRLNGRLISLLNRKVKDSPGPFWPENADGLAQRMINQPEKFVAQRLMLIAMGLFCILYDIVLLFGLIAYFWPMIRPQ